MKRMHAVSVVRGALLGVGLACAGAWASPVIPAKANEALLDGASEPWRAYLVKAREAERIEDPLQRCLAFPDLPDNNWPAGHAAAHCRHHFGIRRPSLEDIEGMVQRGEMADIEALFDASLARHYSTEHFSDDIHDTFNYLLTSKADSERVGALTEAWLRQAPESAYAHLARAAYFNGAAWKARGGKYAPQTPRENMRRMSELAGQAIPHFEKALALNPRLIPAYTGMIDIGMLDSRPELEARARRAAEALDPACPELANVTMRSLLPRWGGSYEQMVDHVGTLSRFMMQRPHLAIYRAQPLGDVGELLLDRDPVPEQALEALEAAIAMGSDEDALENAGTAARNLLSGPSGDARQLAYYLQAARFRMPDAWEARVLGSLLVATEPEWSLKYTLRALELKPDDARAHFNAGAGYQNMGRYDDAVREFDIATGDEALRQASLVTLAEVLLFQEGTASASARKANASRAKPYIDRLKAEYPDDGRWSVLSFYHRVMSDSILDEADVRATLSKLDRSDPWQARHAERLERALRQPARPAKRP